MAEFQERLDRTQRFLLANSICEALEGDAKQKARSELVEVIARVTPINANQNDKTSIRKH